MRKNTLQDFWRFVEKTDACWNWTGSLMHQGYGQFAIGMKTRRAHRVSFEIAHGPIPPGFMICHRCDNRKCVNPDHLFLGTSTDNNRDTVTKGRNVRWNALKTHCKRGHPLSGENLSYNSVTGGRVCNTCSKASKLDAQRKRRGGYAKGERPHCVNLHQYTDETSRTITRKNGRTHRVCLICQEECTRRHRERQRAKGVNGVHPPKVAG